MKICRNMKYKVINILAAAAILTGCQEVASEGEMVLQGVTADPGTNEVQVGTRALPSEFTDVSDFVINIKNAQDEGFSQDYSYSEILDKAITLPTGSYVVTASSPEGKTAEWDQPLFSGSQSFAVVAGATSPVSVKCSLTNAVVSVNCSDTFLTELSTFNIKVFATDNDYLVWTKDNINAHGYFSSSSLTVQIDGERSLDGSTAAISGIIKNINPKDHIILNVDARVTGEVQKISIVIDPSVNDRQEDIIVDGFEEIEIPDPDPVDPVDPVDPTDPVDTDLPTMVWTANPTFTTMELSQDMDVEITINAPKKIKTFVVTVDSPTLKNILPAMVSAENVHSDGTVDLDLIDDPTAVNNLSTLMPTGDSLKGQTSVNFSLSQLVPMILGLSPEAGSDHIFTLKLTDESDNSLAKTLTFHYTGE